MKFDMTRALEILPYMKPKVVASFSQRSDGELRQDPILMAPEAERLVRVEAIGCALSMFPDAVERIRDLDARLASREQLVDEATVAEIHAQHRRIQELEARNAKLEAEIQARNCLDETSKARFFELEARYQRVVNDFVAERKAARERLSRVCHIAREAKRRASAAEAKCAEWVAEYKRWTVANAQLAPEAAILLKERDAAESNLALAKKERDDLVTALKLRPEKDGDAKWRKRVAVLEEALQYYARSPNDNRTRAETVPMIDFVDDTAVARQALQAVPREPEGSQIRVLENDAMPIDTVHMVQKGVVVGVIKNVKCEPEGNKIGTTICRHGTPTDEKCVLCAPEGEGEK